MTDVAERTVTAVIEQLERQYQRAPRHRHAKPSHRDEKPRHRHQKPHERRHWRPWANGPTKLLGALLLIAALTAVVVTTVVSFEVSGATLIGILLVPLVLGINTVWWSAAGIGRCLGDYMSTARRRHQLGTADTSDADCGHRFRPKDVAILIPAHNEAAVLANSLRAASTLVPVSNIFVVSDGSTDRTADVGRGFGVHVLELSPNRGKAGALLEAIRHFELACNFAVVLFLDADTRPAENYLETGLPEFDDPGVVAVAGRVKCLMDPPPRTRTGRFLIAYRARLYAVVQLLVKYGQAANWANVVSIVPGFASMYRSDVLAQIDIAAPGLVIEDFNMTFEVHAKKLGRIAFRPNAAVAYTQDPDSLHDYVHQIRRWSLGFWQTVKLHGLHPGRFWMALTVQIAELLSSSVLLLGMLPLMMFAVYSNTFADTYGYPKVVGLELVGTLSPRYVLIGFLLPDLLLTVFAAIALRRGSLLLLAPLFPAMRLLDAYVCLRSLATAWRTHSSGSWVSPARREDTSLATERRHSQPPSQPPPHQPAPNHRLPDVPGLQPRVDHPVFTAARHDRTEPDPACTNIRPGSPEQRDRRPPRGAGPWTPAELKQVCRCPDCNAHVTITELTPGVYGGSFQHADSCRWYAAYQRDVERLRMTMKLSRSPRTASQVFDEQQNGRDAVRRQTYRQPVAPRHGPGSSCAPANSPRCHATSRSMGYSAPPTRLTSWETSSGATNPPAISPSVPSSSRES